MCVYDIDHLISYFFMKWSTSSRRGIEGMAPSLVMQRKAALLPNSMAARQLASLFSGEAQSSSECLTANAPVKQSPAPTVSTILYSPRMALLMEVTTSPRTATSLVIMAEPLLPSLSSTRRLGCLASSLPLISVAMRERSSYCWLMTMELSSLRSSVSLGEIQVMLSRSQSEMGSSLPPQSRMTTFDCEWAYLAAARLISIGTSFWRRRQSDASMTFLNAWSMSWRLSNSMLVPPQMTMEFSPCASTQMQAMPVYLPSRTFHCRSTLAAFISFSSLVLASSLPTCPRKQLLPASLPTETAWLAPLPPLAVKYLWDCMVSPTAGILLTQRKWSELALPSTHIFLCPSMQYNNFNRSIMRPATLACPGSRPGPTPPPPSCPALAPPPSNSCSLSPTRSCCSARCRRSTPTPPPASTRTSIPLAGTGWNRSLPTLTASPTAWWAFPLLYWACQSWTVWTGTNLP